MRARSVLLLLAVVLAGASCARPGPLTLKAYPENAVGPQEIRFVAKYTGVRQPASIEWTLCRTGLKHEAEMAETRPIVWEIFDICWATTWPQVRLRDSAGNVIATAETDRQIQIGPTEGR